MISLSSCNHDAVIETTESSIALEEFCQRNVSFFDARIRSIDEENYVRELYFANFSEEDLRVNNTYFDGVQYSDLGTENDLIANDGIFTSIDKFQHDNRIQYDEHNLIKSVLEKPVVSPNFVQKAKLRELESTYAYRNLPGQVQLRFFEITCDITWTGGGCRACDWWGGAHCDWCFSLDDCSVTIGF